MDNKENAIKQEVIIPLILKQIVLNGLLTTPQFKLKSKEVTMITMGVSSELDTTLRALGGFASMGARIVKVHLKSEESGVKDPKIGAKPMDSDKPVQWSVL